MLTGTRERRIPPVKLRGSLWCGTHATIRPRQCSDRGMSGRDWRQLHSPPIPTLRQAGVVPVAYVGQVNHATMASHGYCRGISPGLIHLSRTCRSRQDRSVFARSDVLGQVRPLPCRRTHRAYRPGDVSLRATAAGRRIGTSGHARWPYRPEIGPHLVAFRAKTVKDD
jgi:hypothetical protein